MKNQFGRPLTIAEIYYLQEGGAEITPGQDMANTGSQDPTCMALQQAMSQLPPDLQQQAQQAIATGKCQEFIQQLQSMAQGGGQEMQTTQAPAMKKGGFGRELSKKEEKMFYAKEGLNAIANVFKAQMGLFKRKKEENKQNNYTSIKPNEALYERVQFFVDKYGEEKAKKLIDNKNYWNAYQEYKIQNNIGQEQKQEQKIERTKKEYIEDKTDKEEKEKEKPKSFLMELLDISKDALEETKKESNNYIENNYIEIEDSTGRKIFNPKTGEVKKDKTDNRDKKQIAKDLDDTYSPEEKAIRFMLNDIDEKSRKFGGIDMEKVHEIIKGKTPQEAIKILSKIKSDISSKKAETEENLNIDGVNIDDAIHYNVQELGRLYSDYARKYGQDDELLQNTYEGNVLSEMIDNINQTKDKKKKLQMLRNATSIMLDIMQKKEEQQKDAPKKKE